MGSESSSGKLGPKNNGICAAGGSVRSRVFGAGAHFATTCRIDPRVSAALNRLLSFGLQVISSPDRKPGSGGIFFEETIPTCPQNFCRRSKPNDTAATTETQRQHN